MDEFRIDEGAIVDHRKRLIENRKTRFVPFDDAYVTNSYGLNCFSAENQKYISSISNQYAECDFYHPNVWAQVPVQKKQQSDVLFDIAKVFEALGFNDESRKLDMDGLRRRLEAAKCTQNRRSYLEACVRVTFYFFKIIQPHISDDDRMRELTKNKSYTHIFKFITWSSDALTFASCLLNILKQMANEALDELNDREDIEKTFCEY